MRPTHCPKCRVIFEENLLLQAEARHEAAKYGEKDAARLVDSALWERHLDEDHDDRGKHGIGGETPDRVVFDEVSQEIRR